MNKNIIVFLDPDGDIVDYVSDSNTSDTVFSISRELSKQQGEPVVPFYASIVVGQEYRDRIHVDVGAKDPLDTCHKYGLCCSENFKEQPIDRLTRCEACPRRNSHE